MDRGFRARTAAALVTFTVIAAACNGGDTGAPSTTAPATVPPTTSPAPATTTTAIPPSSSTPPPNPPVTTTTMPPRLDPQVLTLGVEPGVMVSYEGGLESTLAWSGEAAAAVFGEGTVTTGSRVANLTGGRRLLVLPSAAGFEIVEDFTFESGSLTTGSGGDAQSVPLGRSELSDFEPATPVMLVDRSAAPLTSANSGAPGVFTLPADSLSIAAAWGPPLPAQQVDEGDTWTRDFPDDVFGPVTIEAAILGEAPLASDDLAFDIGFSGEPAELPIELDLATAFDLASSFGNAGDLELLIPVGSLGSATIRSAGLTGTMRFDPVRGLPVALDTAITIVLDFGLVVDGTDGEVAEFTLEIGSRRSVALAGVEEAAPFEVDRVLARFSFDPVALAASSFLQLPGYEVTDVTDEEADQVFDAVFDVRRDLIAGSAIARVTGTGGESALAVSITGGGEFRGAPFVAEEVAAFLAATRPRAVDIGGRTAYRVTIEDEEWILYNNETHLFITVGAREAGLQIVSELAAGSTPYLWQEGDCLDFADDFGSETPYAPFGLHGLVHCTTDHVYEVIHSEVLAEGPDARFPGDLSERSQTTCGAAFQRFTGTSELETAVSLIRYLPDEEEWEKGSRYFACVVFVSEPEGRRVLTGRIDGDDPAWAFTLDVGSCLSGLFPVECDDPHDREIFALFDLPDAADAPAPDLDDLQRLITESCEETFQEMELGAGPGTVRTFDITDMFLAWQFGERRYYCLGVVFGPDGFVLDITGTLAGGWQEAVERVTTSR